MKECNYAVFGLGAFGSKLARELHSAGSNVVAVDSDPAKVEEIKDIITESIVADAASLEVIRELNVKKFDAVILGMSSHFEDQVLALTYLKQEGAKKVYAKASSDVQGRILSRLGADEIIQPDYDVAERLSRRLTMDNITDMFDFKGSAIAEVFVPEEMDDKSLRELDLRNRYNITVLLIRKPGGTPESIWNPDTKLAKGDQLTVFGNQKSILELFQ